MLILVHVVSALTGIALTTVSYIWPSLSKIRLSFGFVLLTIVSGTIIIVKDHLNIMSVCLSGLFYIGFTVTGLVAANRKLAKQRTKID
jgi:hypothetical protein